MRRKRRRRRRIALLGGSIFGGRYPLLLYRVFGILVLYISYAVHFVCVDYALYCILFSVDIHVFLPFCFSRPITLYLEPPKPTE
jgi:hypothetical protein